MSSFTYKLKTLPLETEILENNNLIKLDNYPILILLEIENISSEQKSAQVYLNIPTSLNSLSDNKFLIKSSSTTIAMKQDMLDISFLIKRFENQDHHYVDLKFGILNSFITKLIEPQSTERLTIKIEATGLPFIGAVNIEVE